MYQNLGSTPFFLYLAERSKEKLCWWENIHQSEQGPRKYQGIQREGQGISGPGHKPVQFLVESGNHDLPISDKASGKSLGEETTPLSPGVGDSGSLIANFLGM